MTRLCYQLWKEGREEGMVGCLSAHLFFSTEGLRHINGKCQHVHTGDSQGPSAFHSTFSFQRKEALKSSGLLYFQCMESLYSGESTVFSLQRAALHPQRRDQGLQHTILTKEAAAKQLAEKLIRRNSNLHSHENLSALV